MVQETFSTMVWTPQFTHHLITSSSRFMHIHTLISSRCHDDGEIFIRLFQSHSMKERNLQCNHVNMNHNLKGMSRISCGIQSMGLWGPVQYHSRASSSSSDINTLYLHIQSNRRKQTTDTRVTSCSKCSAGSTDLHKTARRSKILRGAPYCSVELQTHTAQGTDSQWTSQRVSHWCTAFIPTISQHTTALHHHHHHHINRDSLPESCRLCAHWGSVVSYRVVSNGEEQEELQLSSDNRKRRSDSWK